MKMRSFINDIVSVVFTVIIVSLFYLSPTNIEKEVNYKVNRNETSSVLNLVSSVKPRNIISSYTTSFKSSPEERINNIEIAVKEINGTVINPGDTFSFNKKVGRRSPARGYKQAPMIIGSQYESAFGGGICQVSTTLYNAVIRANIKATERKNHSFAPGYVKPGFDATVSPKIDYKFKNTLSHPIYIEGYIKDLKLTFNIYSEAPTDNIKYKLINEIIEKIPANTERIEDPNLPSGENQVVSPTHLGYKVKVYLVGVKDGIEVSRELISTDVYRKKDGIIKIGTK